MNMKQKMTTTHPIAGMALATLIPTLAAAQGATEPTVFPEATDQLPLLITGSLLAFAVVLIAVLKFRHSKTNKALKDISTELETTRQRFTETSRKLDKTEATLKNTTERYQGMLFDAHIGVFQMDLDGKCTYVNSALQELSGLYPKKAIKEGLQSAIHTDDRAAFDQMWNGFIKNNEPFVLQFRFKPAEDREVHVMCRMNRVLNERKEIESYIGWVSNTTTFHEEYTQQEAVISRYACFIEETIEGYYHLTPEEPIPLQENADKMAATIMNKMILASCNETFSGLYGSKAASLVGKQISELSDGCGALKNNESIKQLIEADYKLINTESVRQDPRGNRLNLMNNIIGIIEDNHLVGIWGSQRNVSQQRREKEELISQTRFMHRILDSMPADVYVKDTRCRYLYASRKLVDRTGIPQEDWVGKTIFEVLPATPRDHDKSAVEVMKSGKLNRVERSYEAGKKSGWMETIQMPLVSEDGLIEGVIGLSVDISERRKQENEILTRQKQLEQHLEKKTEDLQQSRKECSDNAAALQQSRQELSIHEARLDNQRIEFEKKLAERKQVEEQLRNQEEALITHQKQLKDQLAARLSELDAETSKRKKWEELLSIRENELKALEKDVDSHSKALAKEIEQRKTAESELVTDRAELEQSRSRLKEIEETWKREVADLSEQKKQSIDDEQSARKMAERQLKKTTMALESAQERIQSLLEHHAAELQHEVAERKNASAKLIQNSEELDTLKSKFNERIEEETNALKKELAQKQIHEKALRQQGLDLEDRIKDLERTLNTKIQENNKQIEAREGAEVQRQQIEQKLTNMSNKQQQLVERETQKLNLQIAEIRLQEIRLRKEVGDLEQERDSLQEQLASQASELEKVSHGKDQLSTELKDAQEYVTQLKKDQDTLIAKETKALQAEVKKLQQAEAKLISQEEALQEHAGKLERTIEDISTKLKAETSRRENVEKEIRTLEIALDESQENVGKQIRQETKELNAQIAQHKKTENDLRKTEESLRKQAHDLQKTIDIRTTELTDARMECEKAQLELAQVIERSTAGAKEIEEKIADIKNEHQLELKRIKEEHQELRQQEKHYRTLFQGSSDACIQISLKSGEIETANLAAAHLFGEETTKALKGKTLDGFSPEQQADNALSCELAMAKLGSLSTSGHESFEWQFLRADQQAFWGLVSVSLIQVEEHQFALAMINDISDLKKKQADLEQMISEIQAAGQKSTQVVDEIVRSVEETLNPVVDSSSAIEKAENLSEEQQHDMAQIRRNCRTLIDTMHYRSELSHLTDGSSTIESAKCDLHEIIQELDKQFTHRAETKKLFFAVSYAQYQSANNVPKFVETDGTKLHSILSILLGYAVAHTEKGRLGLHAVRRSDKNENLTVAFELAYTGKNTQDDLLAKIFNPDNTEVEDLQYGLTLARRYVQMMGGSIQLEYRRGDITALTVELPFKRSNSEIVMPAKDDEERAGAA